MGKIFEFRGVDNLYFAKILKDDESGYVCSAPTRLAPVAEIGKTTDASNEAHYYDNKALIVVNSESADTIAITLAPPELKILSEVIGRSFDETTGMMVEGPRKNDYYALMYRTKGTDGAYRYVVRSKGQFNIPDETNRTEDASTDTNNTQITFTGIYTQFEFNKGMYVEGEWKKSGIKGIVVDERYELADLSNFFTAVQTPDSISSSPTLGRIDVEAVAGSATGKTAVDRATPITEKGNKLIYKLGTEEEEITYDQALTSGWSALHFDTDIAATAGQVITVVEVTTAGSKARKVGSATVVVAE